MPGMDAPVERNGPPPGTFGLHVKTVSEVSRAIRERVRADDGLRDLWVEGEIGRVTVSTAGHAYFALKDAKAQLQCVWFRDERVRSAFQPQTGLQVIVHGRMDVFEPQGALQLYVDSLQPSGFGNLAIRFEQLKARLSEEGLFDAARKRPLPDRPRVIAVVTSPTGAVWRDVCNVLARRWPLARVLLVACQVQGDGRPAEHRRRAAAPGALDRRGARARAGRTRRPRSRSSPGAGDRWRTCGRSTTSAWSGRSSPTRSRSCAAWVTRSTSRWPTSRPTCARRRRPRRRSSSCRTGVDLVAALRGRRARLDALALGGLGAASREVAAERRLLDRLDPAVRLVESRERASLLLDRATRATLARVNDRARPPRSESRGASTRSRPPASPALARRSMPRRRRWRPSARRPPSSGATRSPAGGATTASSGTRPKRRPARACG